MDARVIYNVPYYMPLGFYIAAYFFITGLNMGFYTASVVGTLAAKPAWKAVAKIGAVGVLIILAVEPIFLILDLGQMPRFWYLFTNMNPTSPVTWGTFFLSVFPVVGIAYAFCVLTDRDKAARVWGLIGFPFAVSVHGYTGFILLMSKGRVLWNASINPFLFLVSALVSGLGLVIIIYNIWLRYFRKDASEEEAANERRVLQTLQLMLIVSIIIDLVLLGSDLALLANHTIDAFYIYGLLTSGSLAFMFLAIQIFFGEVVPLFLITYRPTRDSFAAVNTACVMILVGIFVMRYIMVMGGQMVPLH